MISKKFSAAVMVSDAKRSARWFGRLGFATSVHGHWVTVWPKGSSAKLHLCEGRLEPGNTGIGFYSKTVLADAKRMKAKGVKFTKEVTKEKWGSYAFFSDPDGNVFWLSEGAGP